MATYSTALKNARLQAIVSAIGASGKLFLRDESGSFVIEYTLDSTAGTVSNGTLTFSGFPKSVTASGATTLASAKITDSSLVSVIDDMTVGTSGADIIIDNVNITDGQQVSVLTAIINHA